MEKTFIVKDSSGSVVPGRLAYDQPTKTARFTAENDLTPNSKYYLKITNEVKKLEGNASLPESEWDFTTGNSTSTEAPEVHVISGGNNIRVKVSPKRTIAAAFHDQMVPTSLSA